jgi:hypothetical protein
LVQTAGVEHDKLLQPRLAGFPSQVRHSDCAVPATIVVLLHASAAHSIMQGRSAAHRRILFSHALASMQRTAQANPGGHVTFDAAHFGPGHSMWQRDSTHVEHAPGQSGAAASEDASARASAGPPLEVLPVLPLDPSALLDVASVGSVGQSIIDDESTASMPQEADASVPTTAATAPVATSIRSIRPVTARILHYEASRLRASGRPVCASRALKCARPGPAVWAKRSDLRSRRRVHACLLRGAE